MKILQLLLLIVTLFLTNITFAQIYSGPANGSVPSGVIVNTNNFDYMGDNVTPYVRMPLRNEEEVEPYPDHLNNVPAKGPEGSNLVLQNGKDVEGDSNPIIFKSFQGLLDPVNYIPPDNHIAVGPTHVIGVDNGRFRIWDKNGNAVKTISANAWFSTTLGAASAFDPKVEYDHFNKRWIMVWLDQNDPPNQRGFFLISVSDDSNPIGNWYNWAIASSLNGSTESGTWSDYQGVGFDNQAVYLTGRQFGFTGGFFGCKFRIIGKTQLYANTAGPLSWTDLWDIRDPGNTGLRPDAIRPSVIYGTASEYYFLGHGPFSSNTYVVFYKLTNPLTSPVLTGTDVPVVAYQTPPLASQLGGGLPIESGGSNFRNEPTYRNGFLWATHCVASGSYSAVNYIKINTATNSAVEDYSFGASGFYFFYSAIGVDQNMNLLINYSRSGDNSYIGAYMNSRLATDPAGTFNGIAALQNGKANYSKDFGSGRNRWGDYMGSWVDPSDQNNFWTITEYAETPVNTWASWVNNIRLVPYNGARIFTNTDTLDFGVKEVSTVSDTIKLKITNYGSDTLKINNLQNFNPQFTIVSSFVYPVRLLYQDSVFVKMLYRPTAVGILRDSLRISSNDLTNPVKTVYLKGKGYIINGATGGTMYGVTSTQENGVFITVNTTTGVGTTVGSTGYTQLTGITVRPVNGQIFATLGTTSSSSTQLLRINAPGGDAYPQATVPVNNMRAIAFDLNDVLFGAATDGRLYRINPSTGDSIRVGSTGISNLYGLAINPLNGQLWGVSLSGDVYKINKTTAAATLVGSTTFPLTVDITFNTQGNLYAVSGIGNIISDLLRIDTASGTGTLIGSTGKRINGIAIPSYPIGIEGISAIIPDKYELYQNYPNPFNPVTRIKFDLPKAGLVKLIIYDVLGREVEVPLNKKMDAGTFLLTWDASNYPSGVYFYKMETESYSNVKKLVVVK